MQSFTIVVFGFFLLIVQSTLTHLLPWDMFVPNLPLMIMLYMGLYNYNAGKGAIISFCIGYMMDVFAGSPMGLFTFIAVAVFLFSRLAALQLFLQGWFFEIILAFLLTCIASGLILLLRALFDKDFGSLLLHVKVVVSRAVATAMIAPFIFRLMKWIEKITTRRRIDGKIIRH